MKSAFGWPCDQQMRYVAENAENDCVRGGVADSYGEVSGTAFTMMGIERLPLVILTGRLRPLGSIDIDRMGVQVLRPCLIHDLDDIVAVRIVAVDRRARDLRVGK